MIVLWTVARATFVVRNSGLQQPPTKERPRNPLRTAGPLAAMSSSAGDLRIPGPIRVSEGVRTRQRGQAAATGAMLKRELPSAPAEHVPSPAVSTASPLDARSPIMNQNEHETKRPGSQALLLSGSAWAFWRPSGAVAPLATRGELGGSQVGGRMLLAIQNGGPMRLSLRTSTPMSDPTLSEIAPGISLRPFRDVPVELIVEHRFRGKASDVPSALLAVGVSDRPISDQWRLDAYAQGGAVGFRHPVWFADGAIAVRRPVVNGISLGAGAWGGIQPGLKRLDVGPTLSIGPEPRLSNIRLTVDWRARVAGNARPASGIAVTLAKDF